MLTKEILTNANQNLRGWNLTGTANIEYFLTADDPQPVGAILKNLLSFLGNSSKIGKQIYAIIRAADQAIITVIGNMPINWPRVSN